MSASTYCRAVAVCLRVNQCPWVWFGSCVGGFGACGSLAPLAPGEGPKEVSKQWVSLMRNTTWWISPGTEPPPPPPAGRGPAFASGFALAFGLDFTFGYSFAQE